MSLPVLCYREEIICFKSFNIFFINHKFSKDRIIFFKWLGAKEHFKRKWSNRAEGYTCKLPHLSFGWGEILQYMYSNFFYRCSLVFHIDICNYMVKFYGTFVGIFTEYIIIYIFDIHIYLSLIAICCTFGLI